MSFWQELKKRKVIRVGVAYIIVAWLLVQVADIFFPALKLPEWTITLVAGMVILGFPLALILAWAYDLRPHDAQPASGQQAAAGIQAPVGNKLNYAILALLLIVVSLLLFDRFILNAPVREASVDTSSASSNQAFAGVIPLPDDAQLATGIAAIGFDGPLIALSPDGQWLVYVGRFAGGSRLYRHNLGAFDAPSPINGTEGAIHAFFSPDGRSIGFVTDDKVKRVSLDGQEVRTIAAVTAPVSGRWLDDDTIFLIDGQANAIHRVDVRSGEAERQIYSDGHRFSDVLDDGKYALGVMFPASIDGDQGKIAVVSLEDGSTRRLDINGFDVRYPGDGRLFFSRSGNLQTIGFDPETHEVSGEPRPVLSGVALDSIFYQSQVAISKSGTLAFVPGADNGVGRIVYQARQGAPVVVTPQAMKYGVFDLSHDDRILAIHVGDVTDYTLIYDLENRQGRRLPGSGGYGWPILSLAGDVALSGLNQAESTIIRLGHIGRTANEREIELPGLRGYPMDFSVDGETLAFTEWENGGRFARLPISDSPKPEWIAGEAGDWGAVYSPDGNWFAYASNQTGRYEIWLRPADGTGTPRQLSVGGGIEPVWCGCGEVFYRRGDEIWSTAVVTGQQSEAGTESLVFTLIDFLDTPGRSFDVSSDGNTVYYVQLAEPAITDRIHIISNFYPTLNRTSDAR